MSVLVNVILGVQMLTALGMIGLILVQHGKGADMGAAFGSGSSGSLFGASGSANFLSRTTGVLATVVPPVRAACWKRQPLWLPLRR
jgi:preprotein translocase subunit SecG